MEDGPGRQQLKGLTIFMQYCDRERKATPGAAPPCFYWMRSMILLLQTTDVRSPLNRPELFSTEDTNKDECNKELSNPESLLITVIIHCPF